MIYDSNTAWNDLNPQKSKPNQTYIYIYIYYLRFDTVIVKASVVT